MGNCSHFGCLQAAVKLETALIPEEVREDLTDAAAVVKTRNGLYISIIPIQSTRVAFINLVVKLYLQINKCSRLKSKLEIRK